MSSDSIILYANRIHYFFEFLKGDFIAIIKLKQNTVNCVFRNQMYEVSKHFSQFIEPFFRFETLYVQDKIQQNQNNIIYSLF